MNGLTWTCHICREERPDELIAVYKTDRSKEFDLPPGTMVTNVRYCSDREACRVAAPKHSFIDTGRG